MRLILRETQEKDPCLKKNHMWVKKMIEIMILLLLLLSFMYFSLKGINLTMSCTNLSERVMSNDFDLEI